MADPVYNPEIKVKGFSVGAVKTPYEYFQSGSAVPQYPGYNFMQDENVPEDFKNKFTYLNKNDVGEVEGYDQDVDYFGYNGDNWEEDKKLYDKYVSDGLVRNKGEEVSKKIQSYERKYDKASKLKDKETLKAETDYRTDAGKLKSEYDNGKITKEKYESELAKYEDKKNKRLSEINSDFDKKVQSFGEKPSPDFEVTIPGFKAPVKYNYQTFEEVLNNPDASEKEIVAKAQASLNSGKTTVAQITDKIKNSNVENKEELIDATKNLAQEEDKKAYGKRESGRTVILDEAEAKKDLNTAVKAAGNTEGVKAAAEKTEDIANKLVASDSGTTIQDSLQEVSELGKSINPYYEEGLPSTLYGLYKEGRLGRVQLTEEEKAEAEKGSIFTEDQIAKLREEGKSEEEIQKLQAKATQKAVKDKLKEVSIPARRRAAYFAMDYISKALTNAGAAIGSVGGVALATNNEEPTLKTFLKEQSSGANERYNKAFGIGLEAQGGMITDEASNKTAEIRGDTKLKENKEYDKFKQNLDKDMQAFMSELTIEQTKEIQQFTQELQQRLELELKEKGAAADLQGVYNAAMEGAYMDKGLLKNYAKLLFKADPDNIMSTKDNVAAVNQTIGTVGGFLGNVLGGAGSVIGGFTGAGK